MNIIPPRKKILSILAEGSLKIEIERSCIALFHMKSSLFVKYFVGGCGQSLINKNYHNSRASDDIGINIGPVTKNDKENTSTSKKLMIASSRQVVSSLSFFQFRVNLEQSGSQARMQIL